MDDVSISVQEIVQEIGQIDSRVLELAIERVKSRKLAEALRATTADVEQGEGPAEGEDN